MTKIVSVLASGQMWKDFYIINVSLDNGVSGTALAKSEIPWYTAGTEVEFTQNANGGLKISKVGGFDAPASGGSSDNSEAISRAVAFKGAIELASAGKITLESVQEWTTKLLPIVTGKEVGQTYAQHFPEQAAAPQQAQQVPQQVQPVVQNGAQLNNPF